MAGVIGIVGGGQLGKMLIEHGFWKINSSLKFFVVDPSPKCSCSHLDPTKVTIVEGSFQDAELLLSVSEKCDIMTYEIEHFATKFSPKCRVFPNLKVLDLIQLKHVQKQYLKDAGIPVVPFVKWHAELEPRPVPVILKTSSGGYDGRGVFEISPHQKLDASYSIGGRTLSDIGDVIIEDFIKDRIEISFIVAIQEGEARAVYEPVEMHFTDHILTSLNDASKNPMLTPSLLGDMKKTAVRTASTFGYDGLFAVEMFYDLTTLERFVNEVAPRVHNSGHHTLDSHDISQFEMMARLILGLRVEHPVKLCNYHMKNILGPWSIDGEPYQFRNMCGVLPETTKVYDYCKDASKPQRKLGHITCLDERIETLDWIRVEWLQQTRPIGIVMGSHSDLEIMNDAAQTLRNLNILFEMTVVSAHRTPDRLRQYAMTAEERGLRVIIAGAGGSAHLPSMIAAWTCVPVIGVPIWKSGKPHAGQDALLSIVQMPPGVPVACMAVNGAQNAAIFAASILGSEKVKEYRDNLTAKTEEHARIH